jgi:hypothetical protein
MEACCKDIAENISAACPFRRMVAFDWYDGPTSGVTLCEQCSTSYHFMLVDWDAEHEIRVFSLSPLPGGSFEKALELFPDKPSWPAWMPRALVSPTASDHEFFDRNIQPILDSAGAPVFLLSWSRSRQECLCLRRIDRAVAPRVKDWFSLDDLDNAPNWFAHLGMTRNA